MKIIANTKTKTYHLYVCGQAQRMSKSLQLVLDSDNPKDIEKLRKYKPCHFCTPGTVEQMLSGSVWYSGRE